MPERELNHLLDLCELLPASSDIVVSDGVERVFFLLSLDRFSLAMDKGVWGHDAEGGGLGLDHFELDSTHSTANDECVILVHRSKKKQKKNDIISSSIYNKISEKSTKKKRKSNKPVSLQEVGLEVDLEPISGESFNCVVDGQNVDPLSVLDIGAGGECDHVSETDTEVVADHTVHANLFVTDRVVAENNASGLFALLALKMNKKTTLKLKNDTQKLEK